MIESGMYRMVPYTPKYIYEYKSTGRKSIQLLKVVILGTVEGKFCFLVLKTHYNGHILLYNQKNHYFIIKKGGTIIFKGYHSVLGIHSDESSLLVRVISPLHKVTGWCPFSHQIP